MLLTTFILTSAIAAPSEGKIDIALSPGAKAVVFPRSETDRIEVGIYNNRVPISIPSFSTQWLANTKVTSVGNGTWFVEIQVRRPEIDLTITPISGGVSFLLAPGAPNKIDPNAIARIEDLLSGKIPRRIGVTPGAALHPLTGDASLVTLDPSNYPMPVVVPKLPPIQPQFRDLLSVDATLDWNDIDRYRQVLTSTGDTDARSVANLRLGLAYLDLGYPREAQYYLDVAAKNRKLASPALHLARAKSAFSARRWDQGRDRCRAAYESGGRDADVLECLAVVSLATAEPAPSETARALLAVSRRPHARLLAAELLQKDNRQEEALPILRDVIDLLERPWKWHASAALGDATIAVGNPKDAGFFWARINAQNELKQVLALRQEMASMLEQGPRWWLTRLPQLFIMAGRGDPAAVEARYLIAQIAEHYGDAEQAAEYLTMLLDHHRALSLRSDIPERLIRVSTPRINQLHRDLRHRATVAFYAQYWRPILNEYISDTSTLESVRISMEKLGMYPEALDVQRQIGAVQAREGTDTPKDMIALIRLYALVGQGAEALQTLSFARRKFGEQISGPQIALAEGLAYEDTGENNRALAAYARANIGGSLGFEARARSAFLSTKMQRYRTALGEFESLIQQAEKSNNLEIPSDLTSEKLRLGYARCLSETGKIEEATDIAVRIATESKTATTRQQARDLAASIAFRNGIGTPPAGLEPSPILARLLEEEREAADFELQVQRALGTR